MKPGASIIVITGVLLAGCSSIAERQEHAKQVIDRATDSFVGGIEQAKEARDNVVKSLSGAAKTIKSTADELQNRANQLQNGAKQITNAVNDIVEGAEKVKGALNVSSGGVMP